jgi:hypothetical protein
VTEYDAIKAQRDIVAGADNVHRTIKQFALHARADLDQAQTIYDNAIKVEAWVKADLDRQQAKLNQLMLDANVSAT